MKVLPRGNHAFFFCSVAALSKIINYWNLGSKINLTIDPCSQNATWTFVDSNPRVACYCSSNPCHITHLSAYKHHHDHYIYHFSAVLVLLS